MAFMSGNRGGFLGGLGDTTINGTLTTTGAATLGGALTVPAGAVATPSIKFTGSATNSGIYASTADQIEVGRAGVQNMLLCGAGPAVSAAVTLNTSSSVNVNAKFGMAAETIKTINYTAQNTDSIVIMNDAGGAALTCTLPASGGGNQVLWIKNRGTSNLTVARNGNTIDGAAADLTLAAGAQATLYYETSGWIRIGS